jgi:hypothetical protein
MAKLVTGDQLRADIDAGKTGDKAAFLHPAAAPSRADAEDGGNSTMFLSDRRRTARGSKRAWGGRAFYIAALAAMAIFIIILAWAIF